MLKRMLMLWPKAATPGTGITHVATYHRPSDGFCHKCDQCLKCHKSMGSRSQGVILVSLPSLEENTSPFCWLLSPNWWHQWSQIWFSVGFDENEYPLKGEGPWWGMADEFPHYLIWATWPPHQLSYFSFPFLAEATNANMPSQMEGMPQRTQRL